MSEQKSFTPVDEILFDGRIIQVSGQVNSKMAVEVNRQLLAMERKDSKAPIYLFIDSPGGEINSGFSIFDTVRFIRPEVYTVVCGLAASMGSIISLSGKKENRFAMPSSKFLIHQPLIGGTLYGSASELEIHAKDIIKTRERINKLYADETGQPLEKVAAATDRDNWMSPEEALSFGLISKIIKNRSDLSL